MNKVYVVEYNGSDDRFYYEIFYSKTAAENAIEECIANEPCYKNFRIVEKTLWG